MQGQGSGTSARIMILVLRSPYTYTCARPESKFKISISRPHCCFTIHINSFITRSVDICMCRPGKDRRGNQKMTSNPILIVGSGVSGLLLAQYLRKTGRPFQIFERDMDLATRGLGWGLTLHWSLPALRSLLPDDLVLRLPEAYVDRAAVEQGKASTFPFFDLSTGELKASTPKASTDTRIRVSRDKFRRLLATGLEIQACLHSHLISLVIFVSTRQLN